jgi:hypothetical protein
LFWLESSGSGSFLHPLVSKFKTKNNYFYNSKQKKWFYVANIADCLACPAMWWGAVQWLGTAGGQVLGALMQTSVPGLRAVSCPSDLQTSWWVWYGIRGVAKVYEAVWADSGSSMLFLG